MTQEQKDSLWSSMRKWCTMEFSHEIMAAWVAINQVELNERFEQLFWSDATFEVNHDEMLAELLKNFPKHYFGPALDESEYLPDDPGALVAEMTQGIK